MELTRRELIEDFKPYKVEYEKYFCEYAHIIVNSARTQMKIEELIARDCEQSIIGKQDWTPYDIDETKPYNDATVFQVKRLIKTIRRSPVEMALGYDAYRLSEAKLELISRN